MIENKKIHHPLTNVRCKKRVSKLRSVFLVIFSATFLSGCVSTKTQDILIDNEITASKIIAINGERAPWVYEIEKRLRKNGFKIKRIASQNVSVEQVSPTKTEIYNEAAARFVLNIDGYAPNTSMTRCFGGGYVFDYIDAELIDIRTNETVLHYSNSGHSENCPPLSGTIFEDITQLIVQAWK